MTTFFLRSTMSILAIFAYLGNTEGNTSTPECTFTETSGFCAEMAGRFIRPEYNPNIRVLYIVNCDLTALTPSDFARFQSLSTLHINNSTLPLTTYQHLLSDLKELKDLQITHSNLADNIKYMFANNTGLNNLSLQGNKITQIRKDTFSHLTRLETIDVSNNDISEVDQDSFVNLKHLKKLVLSKNKIGENFSPDSLPLSPDECGVCGEVCPVNATSSCEVNKKADHLWQAFEEKHDILFLEDNPICSTLGNDARSEKTTDTVAAAGAGCRLLHGDECQKHEARREFFTTACTQSGAARRRSGRNHDEDLPSAPEVEDAGDAGDLPDSAPEAEDGGDAGDLPDSAPEAEDGGDAGDLPDSAPQEEDQHDPPAAGASGEAEAEGADGAAESAVEEGPSSTVDGTPVDVGDAGTDDVDDDAAVEDGDDASFRRSSVEVADTPQASEGNVTIPLVCGIAFGGVLLASGVAYKYKKRSANERQDGSGAQDIDEAERQDMIHTNNHDLEGEEETTSLTTIRTS